MQTPRPSKLLRIHLSEQDQHRGRPLYEVIVEKCRELGIAGATVFRGIEGYGESAEMHRSHLFKHDLPIVVTIVDTEPNIARLLPVVETIVNSGLIAVSNVEVIRVQTAVDSKSEKTEI